MKKKDELIELISKIESLLATTGEDNWSIACKKVLSKLIYITEDQELYIDTVSNIQNWFGGMGSFNDIVLVQDGQILINETNKFHSYSDELYSLLIDIRTK